MRIPLAIEPPESHDALTFDTPRPQRSMTGGLRFFANPLYVIFTHMFPSTARKEQCESLTRNEAANRDLQHSQVWRLPVPVAQFTPDANDRLRCRRLSTGLMSLPENHSFGS